MAGNTLKESGTAHWTSPNTNATNTSGFTALGGGYRYYNSGRFYDVGNNGGWWGSTAELWGMTYVDGYVNRGAPSTEFYRYGSSVRCVKSDIAIEPTLTTKPATLITYRSANSGGDIISNGGAPVTERGVCWNTSGNPTISGNHQASADLTNSFINYLDNLTQNTIYYLRAYATTSAGTSYGNEVIFSTLTCPPITATISGTTAICQNSASPNITFTGSNGTAPYTFTYNINGGSNLTISTTSGNSINLAVPTVTTGTFTYNLLGVFDVIGSDCLQTQSGSAVVNVNPLPTAPIVGTITQPTCGLTTGSVLLNGLPEENWTINPGAITGTGASFTISNLTSGTYNFTVTNSAGCTSPASARTMLSSINSLKYLLLQQ